MAMYQLLIKALLVMVVSMIFGAACDDGRSGAQIEADILAAVPLGSSRADIERYLADEEMMFGVVEADPTDSTVFEENQVPPGAEVLVTGINQDGGETNIAIYFVLDDEGDLAQLIVYEQRTS